MAAFDQIITAANFTGLNLRDTPARIKDTELVECINFDIGSGGGLTKRTGFKEINSTSLGSNSVTLFGYFQTSSFNQLLARVGSNVHYSTDGGVTWAVCPGGPHGNVEFGTQYTDKFYFVRRDDVMLEWNGTTMTTIAGSPTGSHVYAFRDRLFVLNTYGLGILSSRLYFSKIADFSATGWPSTNFIDVGPGDGDHLVVTILLQDVLFIFKSHSTWQLFISGDPSTWTLRNLSPELGCMSRYTPIEIDNELYFVNIRGVYKTDGTSFVEVSEVIRPVFTSQVVDTTELNKTFAAWWGDRYIVFLSLANLSSTWGANATRSWSTISGLTWGSLAGSYYQCYVYFTTIKGWSRWEPDAGIAPFNFVEIGQPSTYRGLLAGSRGTSGKVYRFGETIFDDAGVAYTCSLKSKDFTIGETSKLKWGKLVVLEFDTSGGATYTNIIDGVPSTPQTLVCDSGRLAYKLKGPKYFRGWQFSLTTLHTNPFQFYGLSLYLRLKTLVHKSGAI